MKKIAFNIPRLARGADTATIDTAEGYRVHLALGNRSETFVLQIEDGRPRVLAHYASGYRVASLGPRMLERYVANPYAYRERLCDWRREAQLCLDIAVKNKGLDTVRMMLASVPVINGEAK